MQRYIDMVWLTKPLQDSLRLLTYADISPPGNCARRNLAAALEGRNAAPFRLSAVMPKEMSTGSTLITAKGNLTTDRSQAAEMINARLGLMGKDRLSPDRLLLAFPETSATETFINKYKMFLGNSTLKNIAMSCAEGIAFMNSHRTGGGSTDIELPYGRTFCGFRLETVCE